VTASVRRRPSFRRALLGLGAAALLALLALAALLLGSVLLDDTRVPAAPAHVATTAAVGEHHSTVPQFHTIHQQPSTRARGVGFAMLSAAIVVAAWACLRLRLGRDAPVRTLRIAGLPLGRAPPALRIA
jgi:hypothetical protein